jgi:ABC-2 type transport system permease protein
MLMNYLFPLGFYAMMGAVMTQISPLQRHLIPAMVLVAIMAQHAIRPARTLVESREAGIFRSYKINGACPSILSIPSLTTIFHALIVSRSSP